MKYQHLLGREFDHRTANCYTLVRDFYRDNFEIELSDYANPTDWWDHGLNLFIDNVEAEGFELLNCSPREYQNGDLLFMAISSPVANHSSVLVDNGKLLQHLVGQRSRVTAFGGMFRNNLVAAYRHKLVRLPEQTLEFATIIPPHVSRLLQESNQGAPEETPAGV